ncbi:hypothetical protein [Kitasatospora terrestris]|uniref:PD40 domain-containing protein n=1 Tax=Kitasatospora terrestris TaxID=258051 RepID=A0ABP9E7A8_9ACTN
MTRRILVAATVALLLTAVCAGYILARARPAAGPPASGLTLRTAGLLVRDTQSGRLALVREDGSRAVSPLSCLRLYAAAGTGVCLRQGPVSAELVVTDQALKELRTLPLNGVPNRARVSPTGRMVSWTVFVTGDSYNGGQFSTRSGILDTGTGELAGNLENFTVDGHHSPPDANLWGVTFAADDNRFYATLATGGQRLLVRGDFARRDLHVLAENVECPSLSPDGTRIAYKKMLPDRSWRLTVLSLADLAQTPSAETRSVDDQAAWLDDGTLAYALPHRGRAGADVWTVPADGSGTPRLLAADAESPARLP